MQYFIDRKFIKFGKEQHDQAFKKVNWNGEEVFMVPTFGDFPYTSKYRKELQNTFKRYVKSADYFGSLYENMIPVGLTSISQSEKLIHFLRKKICKLCNNEIVRPPKLNKDVRCLWLDHKNPFLKIGPFKFELFHENFEIGLIHDLITKEESVNIQKLAKGKMKTTPYQTSKGGESVSSKVCFNHHVL